jgi:Restriction endonuclease BglII
MKIRACYSHYGGLEYILIRAPGLWKEIGDVVDQVDARSCEAAGRQTWSANRGELAQSLAKVVAEAFHRSGWKSSSGSPSFRRDFPSSPNGQDFQGEVMVQDAESGDAGLDEYRVTKGRIAVEIRVGEGLGTKMDFRSKHLALYENDEIDVGVGIMPTRALQSEMNSVSVCYEDELERLVKFERRSPAVPLVLVGVAP